MNEREIFVAALQRKSVAEQAAYLDTACGNDAALRARVIELLEEHDRLGSFLETPAAPTGATQPEVEADLPLDFLEPATAPDQLGRLGHYEVLELIGRGGMGIVFKALDETLHRVVAIKVLAPQLAAVASARKRFTREAQAAAAVSHDHVVTIHAVAEAKGLPYIAMQFISGVSLQERLDASGPLAVKEVLRIGLQTAQGLAAAHAQGVVHRDIKPANILLENGVERVKITDFGLARVVDDASLTQSGVVAGTPQYMSPEQAQGHAVDARSDLFSLGCVLYAMCTGHPPFRAESTIAAMRRVCDDMPRPIREINSEIPEWLVEIIDRLLAKRPEDRFQTAQAVAQLLGQHLFHVQDPDSTPFPVTHAYKPGVFKKPSMSRRWIAAAVVLCAVLALGATEATGVTHLAGTVVRIVTGEGTLIIETDDPTVQVSLDGEVLTISGGGVEQVRLRPGQYQFTATRNGIPVKQELVTIARGGKRVVTVSREAVEQTTGAPLASAGRGAFVVLASENVAERNFDTLADAVLGASDGDTIEIHGDGPFVTPPLTITRRLTVRAGIGFRPVIKLVTNDRQPQQRELMTTEAALVLEGLELQFVFEQTSTEPPGGPFLLMSYDAPLYIANCRFRMDAPWAGACVALQSCPLFVARNSEFVGTSAGIGSNNEVPDASRWHIDNCIQVGGLAVLHGYVRTGQQGASITLTRNTLVGYVESIEIALWMMPAAEKQPGGVRPIRFDASTNVLDTGAIMCFWQARQSITSEKREPLGSEDAERLLARLVEWHGSDNVYSAGHPLLNLCTIDWNRARAPSIANLADWKQFWPSLESGSLQGQIRFQGGNLLSRLERAPDRLTPDDFRLIEGSAGYRAGPDGKDLGADVDLVGPGAGYERWKRAPEYRQWLKDTGQGK